GDLDDAHLASAAMAQGRFDNAAAAAKYARAFAAYGLEITPGKSAELARRIRAEKPALCEALIVALDDWIFTVERTNTPALARDLAEIVQAVDQDKWRRKYRQAVADKHGEVLATLSAQALKLSLPPATLNLLAMSLDALDRGEQALALMRWAR